MDPSSTNYHSRIQVAMNFISHHIMDEDLTLEVISEKCAISKYHFHRIFKAIEGETVAEFTRRTRLNLTASKLLTNPQLEITEVAYEFGFSNPQNFSRSFKKQFSLSPSDFRKHHAGKVQDQWLLNSQLEVNKLEEYKSLIINSELTTLPDYSIAYIRKRGSYGIENAIGAFEELYSKIRPLEYLGDRHTFGVYWDVSNITEGNKCRMDAGVLLTHEEARNCPLSVQVLKGGKYLVCHYEFNNIDYFVKATDDAWIELFKRGYECAHKPSFIRYDYIGNADRDRQSRFWIFDICIPIKD
ncbi:AraC family transcriptional regulator [Dongshaea marina]|uniref:AraC family transcriptional regulator n=1 Tax=Dongshaea marina TaxID=2047966 RepID=UPI000D3E2726|nr:helix-turn-helix domain-containing protein [Dongshaea marina]